jgi:hypothetical protein
MDPDVEQVTQNIYHNMPLMPFNFFAAINTPLFAGVLGFHSLRVDNPVTRQGGTALF